MNSRMSLMVSWKIKAIINSRVVGWFIYEIVLG